MVRLYTAVLKGVYSRDFFLFKSLVLYTSSLNELRQKALGIVVVLFQRPIRVFIHRKTKNIIFYVLSIYFSKFYFLKYFLFLEANKNNEN